MNAAAFDPLRALRPLVGEKVDFIVIGGLAGRDLHDRDVRLGHDVENRHPESVVPSALRSGQ